MFLYFLIRQNRICFNSFWHKYYLTSYNLIYWKVDLSRLIKASRWFHGRVSIHIYLAANDVRYERRSEAHCVQNSLPHELWINCGIWIRTIDARCARDDGRKCNYSDVLREISARKIWQLIKLMAVSLVGAIATLGTARMSASGRSKIENRTSLDYRTNNWRSRWTRLWRVL